MKVYAVLVSLLVVVGSFLKVDLVWSMSDCFNGLMVIPNLVGILALSGVMVKMLKEYDTETRLRPRREKSGK